MIRVAISEIIGKVIPETMGSVRGSTIRARNFVEMFSKFE